MNLPPLAGGIVLLTCLTIAIGSTPAADPRPLTVVSGGSEAAAAIAPSDPEVAAGGEDVMLEFVRVNAAAPAVPDLPLDPGRYVPMPLAEFEAAVAAVVAGPAQVSRPTARAAEYELAGDGQGSLAGTLRFELGPTARDLSAAVPLGAIAAERCTFRTAAGTGDAVVFGLPDGHVAVHTFGPGSYACEVRLPKAPSGSLLRIPLVPALVTTLRLALPAGLHPVVLGPAAASAIVEPLRSGSDGWQIVVTAGSELPLALWDPRRSPALVSCWNRVLIRGRQATVATRIQPATSWMPSDLELRAESGLVVTGVRTDDGREVNWTRVDDTLRIRVPDRLAGSQVGLVAHGIAPLAEGGQQPVPGLRPPATRWAGCGTELLADSAFIVETIELEHCVAVAASDATNWPLPEATPTAAGQTDLGLPMRGRLFLEHQAPTAAARIAVRPRSPAFDSARVTTVDLSPGTILGRAACDVRVVAGEVFALTANVAPGWFIDSVEAVDWNRTLPPSREPPSDISPGLDWRVVRSANGNELRIGLTVAATPARGLGLRITGHRPGVPLGGRFSTAELDMVQLPGESPESALLEFRVGPMAVVEAEVGTLSVAPVAGRLAPLAAETAPRARVQAGGRAPTLFARLVRRRPPVDAEVRVSLVARDERLAETFSFTCRPVAGEIDAVVVHFSEPIGSGLEWTLVEPATGSLAARRLDPGEAAAGAAMPEDGVAESWLVDVRPATSAMVRINASRTVPLESAVPVPLAWIEAAERPGGLVTIAGEGGQRPELVNWRLREVPPLTHEAEPASVELAYGDPESVGSGGQPAAELLPTESASGSRAWAWRETTTCLCHDSGELEWESVLDIENQGRGAMNLTVPEGLRLEQVDVAGVPITASEFGQSGGTRGIPLPSGRGRLTVVIRGTGQRESWFGWWAIGGIACAVDLPILDRETKLILPPGLDLATGRGRGRHTWVTRLFNASQGSTEHQHAARSFDITSSTRGGVTTAIVVRRRLVMSAAILGGGLAYGLAWRLVRRRGVVAVVGCSAAGILALWCVPPWNAIATAAWWGSVAGAWSAAWWATRSGAALWPAPAAVLVAILWSGSGRAEPVGVDPQPLRVIVSAEGAAGMALVPERLFRRLGAADAAVGSPSLRVLAADLIVGPSHERWRLGLDIDADRGGGVRLRTTSAGGSWLGVVGETANDRLVAAEVGPEGLRLFSVEGGRARVEVDFQPVFVRHGGIETAEVLLPPAAVAQLGFDPEATGVMGWQCDSAVDDGPWLAALASGTGFDISRVTRVRLVRPVNPTDQLVSRPRLAESSNDVSWRSEECRVDATFRLGRDGEIVRRLVLRADPGLVPVPGAAAVTPLGDGRHLLELPEPQPGPRTIMLSMRKPLVDPVGLFDVPGIWIEDVGTDVRTVRLRPEPGLDAAPELPLGTALMRPRAEDGPATTAIWRSEAMAAGADRPWNLEEAAPRPRIAVRRRQLPIRGSQSLVVDLFEDRIDLQLDVELEAATLPLVEMPIDLPESAMIDRVALTRRSEVGDTAATEVDAVWSRTAAGRILVLIQRPDTGMFHLRLNARVSGVAQLEAGRLPLVRAVPRGSLPLALRWRTAPGLMLSFPERPESLGAEGIEDWLPIAPGEPGPVYTLTRGHEPAEEELKPPASEAAPAAALNAGVALTEFTLTIDHRGRGWGLARFDLVAPEPVLQLKLPAGLRLFDVRVDGREMTAVSRGDSIWEVRLHDVSWPRTLVALVAGSLSGPLADGKPIRLEPPRLLGLPVASVIWSLDLPPGFLVRVSEPAHQLDPAAWSRASDQGADWYREAFQSAVAAADPRERVWLEEFAGLRRDGRSPPGEQAWYDAASGTEEDAPGPTVVDAGSDGVITIRPVSERDATTAGRGLATLALAGVALVVWTGGRRLTSTGWRVVARWWWLVCGLVWLLLLTPALPGWLMLAFGGWVALGRS